MSFCEQPIPKNYIGEHLQNRREKVKGYLHIYDRNDALGLVKMPGDPVDRLRDKVQHQVQIHFILLHSTETEELKHVGFNIYLPYILL